MVKNKILLWPAETEIETKLEREVLVLSAMVNLCYLQGKERNTRQQQATRTTWQCGQQATWTTGNVDNGGDLQGPRSRLPGPGSKAERMYVTPHYCSLHKKDGMIDVMSRRCIHEECKTGPCYNIERETQGKYFSLQD